MERYATVSGVEYYNPTYGYANPENLCEYASNEKNYPKASKTWISFKCVSRFSTSGFMKMGNLEKAA